MIEFSAKSIGKNRIEITYPVNGNKMTFNCSMEKFNKGIDLYDSGLVIQKAFSFLNGNEREFLLTGMLPWEYDDLSDWAEEHHWHDDDGQYEDEREEWYDEESDSWIPTNGYDDDDVPF